MKASEIEEIVHKFKGDKCPYNCILISGYWGVGKTYEVKNACSDDDTYISLFGLSSADDIYKTILTKSTKVNLTEKSARAVLRVINGILDKKIGLDLSSVFSGLFSIKELALQKVQIKDKQYFVFDDLERISGNLKIEDVLGAIDSLLSLGNTRIIIIADREKIEDKDKFEQYCEKIVDHTYIVDEISDNAMCSDDRYDHDFIADFFSLHRVYNLRTLQRAQQFYEDVYNEICDYLKEDEYRKIIQEICYAVVFEELDKVYRKVLEDETDDTIKLMMREEEDLISIKYLHTYGGTNLTKTMLDYYKFGKPISKDIVRAYFDSFKQSGEKHNFYKSQVEIRNTIDALIEDIRTNDLSINEIIEKANIIMTWQKTLNINDTTFEQMVFEKLKKQYSAVFHFDSDKSEDFYELSDTFNFDCSELKIMLKKLYGELTEEYWNTFYDKFRIAIENKDYDVGKIFAIFMHRRIVGDRDAIKRVIPRIIDNILTYEFAPTGSISESQYMCFSYTIEICSKYHPQKTNDYLESCRVNFEDDMMLANRINSLQQHYHLVSVAQSTVSEDE